MTPVGSFKSSPNKESAPSPPSSVSAPTPPFSTSSPAPPSNQSWPPTPLTPRITGVKKKLVPMLISAGDGENGM